MSYKSKRSDDQTISDLVAEARALRIAVVHGAISYKAARLKAKIILREVNGTAKIIAKKHGFKYKRISFSNL